MKKRSADSAFYIALSVFVAVLLLSCGREEPPKPEANQQGFGLGGQNVPDDYYCPDGYSYDSRYHVCEGRQGVLGPFSEEMVYKCKSFGGGAPCDGLHWQPEFAHAIRGTGRCPNGTQWDNELEVCFSGENVYGPFLKSQYEKCLAASGGPACETMRWSRSFFESFRKVKPDQGAPGGGEFSFAEPANEDVSESLSLWATYYWIPTVADQGKSGYPLLDMNGKFLGASLTRRDWCNAALEGSVRVIDANGDDHVFNYVGSRQDYQQIDCSDYVSLPGLGYSRFYRAKGHFGDGVSGYMLQPYRTIAVDPSYIPYGTVLYIPSARGTNVVLPNGKQAVHDGYFYAADTGGALHGNHIDVFIGSAVSNPFQFIRSSKSGSFKAFVINSAKIRSALKTTHSVR